MHRGVSAMALCVLLTGSLRGQGPARLEITVDPRVELLSIVQLLGDRMDNGLAFPYKQEVLKYFAPWHDHPAVRRIRALLPDALSWGLPAILGVSLGPLPELAVGDSLPTQVANGPVSHDTLAAYVAAVRDFARTTHFDRFFAAHRAFYDSLVTATRASLGVHDWLADVERYWGWQQAGYHIFLSPLMPAGGVGPRVPAGPGRFEVFSILGATGIQDGLPLFGSEGSLRHLVLHEFSHAFVNAATDEFAAQVDRWSLLLYPLRNRLRQADGLTAWRGAVDEFIIRAFTSNITETIRGDSAAQAERQFQRTLGFEYINAFAERLKEYDTLRARYPTFRDFYPRMVGLFADLAGSGLAPENFERPFSGNIAMARWHDENFFWVFIVPTAERDPALQDSLTTLVRRIRDERFRNSFIITDRDALNQDLARYGLYVFGTMEGNLWLKAHRDAVPAQILPDRIVADRVYPGTTMTFTSALPNPFNMAKPMIVSTGQRIEDVAHSYWVWTADFAIMDGTKQLQIADYARKDGERWAFH